MTQLGPFDLSNVQCYEPDGCCWLPPDRIPEDEFLCAVKALLPEGPLWIADPTQQPGPVPPTPPDDDPDAPKGPIPVGCGEVGCTPVCSGVPTGDLPCTPFPEHSQIDVVDAFGATAYAVLQSLSAMLKELDPCTATYCVDAWLARYGATFGPCDPSWSAETKQTVLCLLSKLSAGVVLNKANLDAVAAHFGVVVSIYVAGEINPDCGGIPGSPWTLARSGGVLPRPGPCAPLDPCDPDAGTVAPVSAALYFNPPCGPPFPSLDLVVCPAETTVPETCLSPGTGGTVTPSNERYEAFQWLLQRLIPAGVDLCVYRCEDLPCLPEPAPTVEETV